VSWPATGLAHLGPAGRMAGLAPTATVESGDGAVTEMSRGLAPLGPTGQLAGLAPTATVEEGA
jgi:hypothetical protein